MSRGILFVAGTRAVATVNRAINIQEKDRPALIVIELKEAQIDTLHLHEPDADELLFKFLQFGILTNKLFVQSFASHSGDAPEKNEQRLARLFRARPCLWKVVVNPMRSDTVFERVAQVGLGVKALARRGDGGKEN